MVALSLVLLFCSVIKSCSPAERKVIKAPLRHFKRPAYASSSYAPSVPKKTDEHPARYKMLDQRIKMKKIQNISHNWNRK